MGADAMGTQVGRADAEAASFLGEASAVAARLMGLGPSVLVRFDVLVLVRRGGGGVIERQGVVKQRTKADE